MKRLLAILPSRQDREELKALESAGIEVIYVDDPDWRAYEAARSTFDPVNYTRRAIELGRDHRVDGVFFSDDLGNLIGAVVGKELELIAPSVESMFLANHKLYARAREHQPIRYTGFRLDQEDWRSNVAFPGHVKPASLSFSVLQRTVASESELVSAVETFRKDLADWDRPYRELYRAFVDCSQFPLADAGIFIAEEFVESRSQHAVEGWTDVNGRHYLWAISDNNYFSGPGSSLDNNSVPSRVSAEDAERLVEASFNYVTSLGLRGGFWNIELWILQDGSIKVTEINGRGCVSMTALYKRVLGKSQYAAIAKLAANLPIADSDMPRESTGSAGMFALSTNRTGVVSELIDIDQLEKLRDAEDVIRTALIYPADTYIDWKQTGGRRCLARVWLHGQTYDAIHARAESIRSALMK